MRKVCLKCKHARDIDRRRVARKNNQWPIGIGRTQQRDQRFADKTSGPGEQQRSPVY
jgi:hypothetical protein